MSFDCDGPEGQQVQAQKTISVAGVAEAAFLWVLGCRPSTFKALPVSGPASMEKIPLAEERFRPTALTQLSPPATLIHRQRAMPTFFPRGRANQDAIED